MKSCCGAFASASLSASLLALLSASLLVSYPSR